MAPMINTAVYTLARLCNQPLQRAIERPDVQHRLIAAGMEPPPSSDLAGVRSFIAKDIARWTQHVDAIGLDKMEGEAAKR